MDKVEKLLSELNDELVKGGWAGFAALTDFKGCQTLRMFVSETTLNPQPLTPQVALLEAMSADDEFGQTIMATVFNSVLMFLSEHPERIAEFRNNFNMMVEDTMRQINLSKTADA